jgi:curli biogenesis system outer membrane secretion channel CsgG
MFVLQGLAMRSFALALFFAMPVLCAAQIPSAPVPLPAPAHAPQPAPTPEQQMLLQQQIQIQLQQQQQQIPQPGQPAGGPMQLPHQGNLQNAPTSAATKRFADRPAVTIREFRSSVAEVTSRGATDMFMTALVKTRKFRVLERARMAEGIAAEKALNQQGVTTGQTGQAQYAGAAYMFEATVSEATTDANKTAFSLGIAGAAAGKGWSSDTIAIDVRVTDVESGIVVDAIDVRKEIKGEETKAGGLTNALANTLLRGRGAAVAQALAPTDEYVSARKDSVDKALRAAIEEAVNELAKRFAAD